MMRHVPDTAILAVVLTLCGCGDSGNASSSPPPQNLPTADGPVPSQRSAPAVAAAPTTPSAQSAAPAPEAGSGDLAQLRHEVAGLQRELAELRLQIARMPLAAQSGSGFATPPPPSAADAVVPTETSFRSEQIDAAWSRNAASSVRSAMSQSSAELDRQIRRIECRSKTCRIEIDPSGAEALDTVLPAILAYLAPTMPSVAANQIGSDDGTQPTVLYLTR